VDILLEVSLLSSHLALPRSGHLQQVYLFDPDHPRISQDRFQEFDWVDFYKDAEEEIPMDAPTPRGREVQIHFFVDANKIIHHSFIARI